MGEATATIEALLERIAIALEKIASNSSAIESKAGPLVKVPKSPGTGRVKKSTQYADPNRIEQLKNWYNRLYGYYPRHVAKEVSWKAFVALDPDLELCRVIVADIKSRIESGEWKVETQEERGHIPLLSTYLNQRRWED